MKSMEAGTDDRKMKRLEAGTDWKGLKKGRRM
jgi:hypothetical protein